jgi:hypothetical protein
LLVADRGAAGQPPEAAGLGCADLVFDSDHQLGMDRA